MKKLLIITIALLLATHVSANKNDPQKTQQTTNQENTQKGSTHPAPTLNSPLPTTTELGVSVNLSPTTGGPQPAPNPPNTTIIREVENSVQPDLLKELEDVRVERKLLREQKQALLDEVKILQSDKADLKKFC